MYRSGRYLPQPIGYKAINVTLGSLEMLSFTAKRRPYYCYVCSCKEVLFSSQIEGTQASLDNVFAHKNHLFIKNVQDVEEVVNYIKTCN